MEAIKQATTIEDYQRIFETERKNEYPVIDAFERATGYAIDRKVLELMARELACPFKRNPPNWQHGRVIYAALRDLLHGRMQTEGELEVCLDIGTAKGFSAMVMAVAIGDAGWDRHLTVHSVDVIDPKSKVARNSVTDVMARGPLDVYELTAPHLPRGIGVEFSGAGAVPYLTELVAQKRYVPFAFVDGKHTAAAVTLEAQIIARLQRASDVIVFDDLQIPGVGQAVRALKDYRIDTEINIGPRTYAIAVRK